MSFGAHFGELRRRLILALIGWGAGTVGGWFVYTPVIDFISRPLAALSSEFAQLNFQTISAALDLKLKVAAWIGLVVTSPWWIYQFAAFIGPGLKRGERRHAVVFGLIGAVLFAGGSFSGVLVAPKAVEVLLSFVPDDAAALLAASSYVNFYMYVVIAFGVSFLLPEILVALNFLGLVKARTLLRGWRVAVFIAFTLAAVINPLPSPLPMIIQALAMMALYFAAILVAHLHDRRKAKAKASPPSPAAD